MNARLVMDLGVSIEGSLSSANLSSRECRREVSRSSHFCSERRRKDRSSCCPSFTHRLITETTLILLFLTSTLAFTPAMRHYKEAVQQTWHNGDAGSTTSMKDLVRYATLAPSGHNSQCWKFQITSPTSMTILPDFDRRTQVVDPDDHHLFVSLGCAVENLVIAGLAHGLQARVDSSNPADGIQVDFTPCPAQVTPQYDAIPNRQVTRTEYNGEKLSNDELQQLQQATDGANGVHVLFLIADSSIQKAQEYIVRANTIQLHDDDFRKELKEWIRFSERECITKGDGLMGPTTGNPFAPRFLGTHIVDWTVKPKPENTKIAKQLASSAGIAVFWSEHDDAAHWVEAGRLYERFALAATFLNIKNTFLNQPVEVAEIRPVFAQAFGIQGRPDLIVRFGKGADMPHSLRRPVDDVIVQ